MPNPAPPPNELIVLRLKGPKGFPFADSVVTSSRLRRSVVLKYKIFTEGGRFARHLTCTALLMRDASRIDCIPARSMSPQLAQSCVSRASLPDTGRPSRFCLFNSSLQIVFVLLIVIFSRSAFA